MVNLVERHRHAAHFAEVADDEPSPMNVARAD